MSSGTLAYTNRDVDGPLKHITDATFHTSNGFSFNADLNLHTGKVFKINNVEILSASTLSSAITSSSLTTVGILTTLKLAGALNLDSNNITNGGTITASSFVGPLTGNANTATTSTTAATLATPRNIGGVAFNGSADINLPGVNASGNQDTSGNAATVTGGVYITGAQTITGAKTFNSTITGDLAGNASTATALQTARTIGGVSFNGTANINLPGVNAAGNQNTTGNAATSTTAGTVTTAAQPNITSLGNLTGLNINGAFTFPTSDGSANQVLSTNGSGTLSWAAASSGNGVVSGILSIDSEQSSSPSAPSNGSGGKLYTKADGKLYWISYDVSETAVSDGGGGGGGGGSASLWYEPFGMLSNSDFSQTETVCTTKQVTYYHGFLLKSGGTYNKIRVRTRAIGGSGSATVNVAIYSSNGNSSVPQPNSKLVNASQASVSTSNDILSITITDTVLTGGTMYYVAIMWNSASATCGFYGTSSIGTGSDHKMIWKETGTTSFPSTAGGSATSDSAFWFVLSGAEGSATTMDLAESTSNGNFYPTFASAVSGSQSIKTNSNLNYNPSTGTLSLPNLTVTGTTTTVNSTTVTIADPILQLGGNASDDNLDRGLVMLYNDGSARKAFMGYDDSDGKFAMLTAATDTSNVFTGTKATLKADLEGNATTATTAGTVTTAAQPSITSVGNLTGLTVDTDTLYVDSTNNRVGIGTTSPSAKLEVTGTLLLNPSSNATNTTAEIAFVGHTQSTNSYYTMYSWDDNLHITHRNTDWTLDTTAMTFIPSGNVGIGTTTPAEKLDVNGNIRAKGTASASSTTTAPGQSSSVSFTSIPHEILHISTYCSDPGGNANGANTHYTWGDVRIGGDVLSKGGNTWGSYPFNYGPRMVLEGINFRGSGNNGTGAAVYYGGDVVLRSGMSYNGGAHAGSAWNRGGDIVFERRGAFGQSNGNVSLTTTIAEFARINMYYGRMGILNKSPTCALDVTGVVKSNGTTLSSDDRIKFNEQNFTNCLDTINKLTPQKYEKIIMKREGDTSGTWIPTDAEWNSVKDTCVQMNDTNGNLVDNTSQNKWDYKTEIGFIAQTIKQHVPELAFLVEGDETDAEGNQTPLSLDYNGIFTVACGAIKELSTALNAEKAKVTALETKMQTVLTHLGL